MDRSSVRSFRAVELAERALRDLAKSRLDTTREVAFRGIGPRFHEAREDVGRIADLLREDAFRSPSGHFARIELRLEQALAERLSSIEPRAVEARLEDATRSALQRELPGAQGVYLARFEASARGDLEPVVRAHLSCRLADESPAPMLTRADARRIQEGWAREAQRAFGLDRGAGRQEREHGPTHAAIPSIEWGPQRQELARAQARLFAVHTERLAGRATTKDLAGAMAAARTARAAWNGKLGPSADLRDLDRRQVFDVIHIKVEGGSRYLGGALEAHRRAIVEGAASRAAGVPEDSSRRLSAVVWPAGPDLQGTLYFNQRSQPKRQPDNLDPERVREALAGRLREELRTSAIGLDPAAQARAEDLGRVEAVLRERKGEQGRTLEVREKGRESEERPHHAPIKVLVDLERQARASTGAPHASEELLDRAKPKERDWGNERVFAIRVRVPLGGEQLGQLQLSAEETAHVIQRAVERAYPFLAREGVRDNFIHVADRRALDVRIIVPEKLGWTPTELRSPQFQQRFITGFHQALSQIAPNRLTPQKQRVPDLMPALRAIQLPLLIRRIEQDPERVAKEVAHAVFDRLTQALPKPFRVMRELGRTTRLFDRGRE